MNLVHSVFIITNILGTFSVFKLISIFFERKYVNKYIEFISYTMYFIASCFIFIFFPIPIFTLFFNVVAIFVISFNYNGNMKSRIMATIYVYSIMFVIEIACMIFFEYKKIFVFEVQDLKSVYVIIIVKALVYIASLIFSEKKAVMKKDVNIATLYWIGVVSVPVSSLIVIILFLNIATGNEQVQILFVLVCITAINFVSFQLYSHITSSIQKKNKKIILKKQSESYLQQLKMIQKNNANIALIHHDIKNHLFMMKSLYEQGEIASCNNYFDSLLLKIECTEDVCRSGNLIVDGIVNYKLSSLSGVDMHIDVCIPKKLKILDVDVTSILGNLLDNSVRAVKKVQECGGSPMLYLNMRYSKGRLFLQVENSYKNVKVVEGILQTTKRDKESHGIGIESVRNTVDKYNGMVELNFMDNIFSVSAVLYC